MATTTVQENGINLNDVLREGIELNRQMTEMSTRLDAIKKLLREEAEAQREDAKTVNLTTEDGDQTVAVTFPGDTVKVTAKVEEMAVIRDDVGALIFDMFFEEKVSYKAASDFDTKIEKIKDPIQRQSLESVIKVQAATPRVAFPK